MIRMQGRSNCEALISGSRLNPSPAEGSRLEKFSVGHTIQGASPGHGQIFQWHSPYSC